MVFGAYRRDDFADPEVFLAQLGIVLQRYSDTVIVEATSPMTGLQHTCKFPPSIAEATQFCDELKRRSTYASKWDEHSRKQLDEREEALRQAKAETAEHRAAIVARIKADLAKRGMHMQTDPQAAMRKEFPERRPSGNFANMLVHREAPQYTAMCEKAASGADAREYYQDPHGRGIWVLANWLDHPTVKLKTWKQFTDADMRAMYPPRAQAAE
jgi:hypothetical protein